MILRPSRSQIAHRNETQIAMLEQYYQHLLHLQQQLHLNGNNNNNNNNDNNNNHIVNANQQVAQQPQVDNNHNLADNDVDFHSESDDFSDNDISAFFEEDINDDDDEDDVASGDDIDLNDFDRLLHSKSDLHILELDGNYL